MSKLLIDEPPLQVLKSLVIALGLEKAIVLQQIHWMLKGGNSGQIGSDGHKYVWKSAQEFREDYFPFWTEQNIRKHIRGLEARGVLISHRMRRKVYDQTKFYRINYEALEDILEAELLGTVSEDAKTVP